MEKNYESIRKQQIIDSISNYKKFLSNKHKTLHEGSTEDFYTFSKQLINQNTNSYLVFQSLLSFANFANIPLISKLAMEVLDGNEVIGNLSDRLIKEFDENFRNEIFKDVSYPELGITPQEKPYFTKILINRLVDKLDVETAENFLSKGLRDRYEEFRKQDREKYLELGNIDEFLKWRFESFIKELEEHRDKGTILFMKPRFQMK